MTGHRATRALRGVLLLLMGVALAACREDGATYRSDTGVVTASDQRPGDPDGGLHRADERALRLLRHPHGGLPPRGDGG
jgi:hypothetical protein